MESGTGHYTQKHVIVSHKMKVYNYLYQEIREVLEVTDEVSREVEFIVYYTRIIGDKAITKKEEFYNPKNVTVVERCNFPIEEIDAFESTWSKNFNPVLSKKHINSKLMPWITADKL